MIADPEAMIRFIEKQANAERLDLWSVVVMHGGAVQPGATEEPGVFNLGLGARHCVERSRYTAGRPDDVAYLKALSTGWDWIADLDFRGNRVSSWRKSDFLNFRRQVLGDLSLRTGVLVLYPIWKDSRYKPTGKASPHRADLGASADLMGFSVIFPEGRDDDDVTQSFVSVRVLPYRYDSAVEVEDAPEGPADE